VICAEWREGEVKEADDSHQGLSRENNCWLKRQELERGGYESLKTIGSKCSRNCLGGMGAKINKVEHWERRKFRRKGAKKEKKGEKRRE